jgi:hypothetical protein
VFATKVLEGAWIAVVAMVGTYVGMRAVRRHYDRYDAETAPPLERAIGPSHVHAVVLVGRLNRPALRAVALARSLRTETVEAVAAGDDPDTAARLQDAWRERGVTVPLRILDTPYRDIAAPLLEHIAGLRGPLPQTVVLVFVPEVVVAHWWQSLLHNQQARRLKARLLQEPGIVVIDVPYRLGSREMGWLAGGADEPVGPQDRALTDAGP